MGIVRVKGYNTNYDPLPLPDDPSSYPEWGYVFYCDNCGSFKAEKITDAPISSCLLSTTGVIGCLLMLTGVGMIIGFPLMLWSYLNAPRDNAIRCNNCRRVWKFDSINLKSNPRKYTVTDVEKAHGVHEPYGGIGPLYNSGILVWKTEARSVGEAQEGFSFH